MKLNYNNISENHDDIIKIINIHKYQCFNRGGLTKILLICDAEPIENTVKWIRDNYKVEHSVVLKGKNSIAAFIQATQETVEGAKAKMQAGNNKLPIAVIIEWTDEQDNLYSLIQSCFENSLLRKIYGLMIKIR